MACLFALCVPWRLCVQETSPRANHFRGITPEGMLACSFKRSRRRVPLDRRRRNVCIAPAASATARKIGAMSADGSRTRAASGGGESGPAHRREEHALFKSFQNIWRVIGPHGGWLTKSAVAALHAQDRTTRVGQLAAQPLMRLVPNGTRRFLRALASHAQRAQTSRCRSNQVRFLALPPKSVWN